MCKFGDIVKIGVDGFANEIDRIRKNHKYDEEKEFSFFNFEPFKDDQSPIGRLKDDYIFDLFKNGEFKKQAVKLSVSNPENNLYMVKRTKVRKIVDDLINKNARLAIIHSDLGNGKTGLINLLKYELIQQGKVFELKKNSNTIIKEFEYIANLKEPVFILIESYNLYLDVIGKFKLYLNDNIKFIMTSRSLAHDVNYYNLVRQIEIDERQISSYPINRLDDDEIEQLINIFDEYSLWGVDSNKSKSFKRSKFDRLKRNFQNILLNFDSNYIKNQLDNIVKSIKEKQEFYEVIMLVLLNEVMERILDVDDLIYLLDSSLIYNSSFKRNADIGEIIDFDEYCPKIKSSLTAKYILEKANDSESLIKILIDIAKKADKKTYISKYKNLLRYLVSFTNIRYLLYYDKDNFNNLIINYYENIKNLRFNKSNSYFWLQYAIARLELKQYKEAKLFFENAYSYANNNSTFNTIQIDTHYARFILENQLFSKTNGEEFLSFREAHGLIMRVRKEKLHLHYPLRQTGAYYDYYLAFYKGFTDQEKIYFINACIGVKEKIQEYFKYTEDSHGRRDHVVVKCYESLNSIIERECGAGILSSRAQIASDSESKNI
jgi:hypothetical protein